FLRRQPAVASDAIGAWGISQSGWVLPRLAGKYPLRFVICVTGGAVSPRDVEIHGYESKLEHSGVGDAERNAALALVGRYLGYLESGADRAGLMRAFQESAATPWFKLLGIDRVVPDEADRPKWSWVASYDPIVDIETMKMPVLVLLGARDPFLPTDAAQTRWS